MEEPIAKGILSLKNNNVEKPDETISGLSQPNETETELSEDVLRKLSKQLEYYFSTKNLSKDTYLRTLRELNDGYVPASILANFGKVRLLLKQRHDVKALVKAASDFSNYLEVVHVDKESNEKVLEAEGRQTILAIGPKDSKPIDIPDIVEEQQQAPSILPTMKASNPSSSESLQKTIILREVPRDTNQDDIRELFNFENCPPIREVREDVAFCWFVTLESTSRDDMMQVMLALRSKKLKGEDIKARLKSGTKIASRPPPAVMNSTNLVYAGDRNFLYHNKRYGGKSKGKYYQPEYERRHVNGKKSRSRSHRGSGGGQNQRELSKEEFPIVPSAPPPQLEGPHFPALELTSKNTDSANLAKRKKKVTTNNKKHIEDEGEEEDGTKTLLSDGASTATTSTSSSVDNRLVATNKKSGYAAALLKCPPAGNGKLKKSKPVAKESKQREIESPQESQDSVKDTVPFEVEQPSTNGKEIFEEKKVASWGGGKSFADVLK